jgi:hypothetical protein
MVHFIELQGILLIGVDSAATDSLLCSPIASGDDPSTQSC